MSAAGALDASVIIPARNAARTITAQLDALTRQAFRGSWEVLVVDNASTDDTAAVARRYSTTLPGMTVLSCPRPGANAARNVGLRAARGRVVLFCDADDIVADDWIAAMVRALGASPVVAGAIDDRSLNSAEVLAGAPRRTSSLEVSANFLPRGITANLGVRTDAARAIGGFDEAFQFGATDTEFCWRLQLAGYSIAYESAAVVAWRRYGDLRTVSRKAFKTGRAHARLFRLFRAAGMPRTDPVRAVVGWARLLVTAPFRMRGTARREWVRAASASAGRLVGSVEQRVLYL
jgi:glycosyltransferase involved in cell wall biosynthesis